MAAIFNTLSKTTASGASASAAVPVHVRNRIALPCAGSGIAEQTELMDARNTGGVDALVVRCLR